MLKRIRGWAPRHLVFEAWERALEFGGRAMRIFLIATIAAAIVGGALLDIASAPMHAAAFVSANVTPFSFL